MEQIWYSHPVLRHCHICKYLLPFFHMCVSSYVYSYHHIVTFCSPFELIAKITLIVCLLLFILDPYPGSRIVSFCAMGSVLIINRVRQKFLVQEVEHQEDKDTDKSE